MSSRLLALGLSLLGGCNDLLGFGEPTLTHVDADPARPSCETGWPYRLPIELQNLSTSELRDYQVMVQVDTAAVVRDQKLQPNGSDIRFTIGPGDGPLAHVVEAGIATSATTMWINVPVIPVGASTLYMYYGNPGVEPWGSAGTFLDGVITNASFESSGGWTIEPSLGPPAGFDLRTPTWFTDGEGSLRVNEQVSGDRLSTSWSAISQPTVFPAGTDYVIRFDLNVLAASNGGVNGANDGAFLMTLGNGINSIWSLDGGLGNITGVRLGEETAPFGPGSVPLTIAVRVTAGSGPGYAKGHFDHLRVRKHVSPEPTVQVGSEELTCSP